jgi:hypothetical protein
MTGKTSRKAPKAAKKTTTQAAAAKTAKPRKPAAKSSAGKPGKAPAKQPAARKASASKPTTSAAGKQPALLSGGNPQIPKGYGDAPVQAYIAAMPGWQSKVGRRLDALIARAVPKVRKAVKWNSPFYGVEDDSWFLSYHCFAKYIKLAFFRGASLDPPPPVESKHRQVRYLHIHQDEPLDEGQFTDWVKQASRLPGERM